MFKNAAAFNQSLTSWDVSSVTNMKEMFAGTNSCQGCGDSKTHFNQDISGWNVSNVKDMSGMFSYNESFNQKIGVWKTKTANVTDMSMMFYKAIEFDQDVSGWDVKKVQDMYSMFEGASKYNHTSNDWRPEAIKASQNCSKLTRMFGDTKLSCGEVRGMIENWGLKGVCTANQLRGYCD